MLLSPGAENPIVTPCANAPYYLPSDYETKLVSWRLDKHAAAVASLPALKPWAPLAERGPSLESIYRVSLTVDLCDGNKVIQFGAPQKEKNPGALGTCPVWPLVKTALRGSNQFVTCDFQQ